MRVEAGRHENELRVERANRRLDELAERPRVVGVSRPRREWQVEGVLVARPRTAGAGIERPLVDRHEEHGRVVAERRLRPVPVMNVEVHDRDALDAELGLGVAGGDRDVVEDAEPHRAALEGVMPRRSDEREALLLDRDQRAARGQPSRLPGRLVRVRVGEKPGLDLDRLDGLDVLGGMNALDRLSRRRPPFDESRERAEQPREPLGILVVEVALGRVQLRQRPSG